MSLSSFSRPALNKVINLCLEKDVKFIVHVILHRIIQDQDQDEQVTKAADYVIGRYNKFLEEENEYGICLVDNLPTRAQFRYLSEKFQVGLSLPHESRTIKLDRIQLFGATCINASHVNSAIDIILGAFRYCINNPRNPEAAITMMAKTSKMMWGLQIGDKKYVKNRGLIL